MFYTRHQVSLFEQINIVHNSKFETVVFIFILEYFSGSRPLVLFGVLPHEQKVLVMTVHVKTWVKIQRQLAISQSSRGLGLVDVWRDIWRDNKL